MLRVELEAQGADARVFDAARREVLASSQAREQAEEFEARGGADANEVQFTVVEECVGSDGNPAAGLGG